MSKWIPAGENMIRNSESGMYYVRVKRAGRQIWKALKTDKITIARQKRAGVIDKIDAQNDSIGKGALTLGKCVAAYLQGKQDEQLKVSSYKYCELSVKMIRDNFKHFDARAADSFTPYDCKVVCDRLRAKYSKRRFNGALWTLRGILEVAKKAKFIKENPAEEIQPEEIHRAKLNLPAEEKIELLMDRMRRYRQTPKNKNRPRFNAYLFLTLMLESSQRPGSIRLLRPDHVNLKRGTVDWLPFKHSPTTDTLPMTRKMKAVFRLLLRKHPGGKAPLVPIKFPRKALIAACKEVGITPALTPHKFRHICSTRMAERNIPYALAAQWRRDRDGGRTFMKDYVHPRNESLRQVVNMLDARNKRDVETSEPKPQKK